MKNPFFRLVLPTFAIYICLGFLVITPIHELGHALVCNLQGHQAKIWFDLSGGHVFCPSTTEINYVAGPSLGALSGLALILLARKIGYKPFYLATIGVTIEQGTKVIFEGLLTVQYETHKLDGIIALIQTMIIFLLLVNELRKQEKPKAEPAK